jgi:hypothetical protein
MFGALLFGCGGTEEVRPAACYSTETNKSGSNICEQLGSDLCDPAEGSLPTIGPAATIVPDGATMPAGVVSQGAHNNLDLRWHNGRLFFAFRTAPNHYASPEATLYIVSTDDYQTWLLEAEFKLDKDLREPRFLSVGNKLFFYFAKLGEVPLTFQPEAVMFSEQRGGCDWSAAEAIDIVKSPGFIPWRSRTIDGTTYLIGYEGGEDIYELGASGVSVHWLKTDDGRNFEPVIPKEPIVLQGGVSETDFAFVDDGSLIAVSRNESGDEASGFGSKICRAEADDLGTWNCISDKKKYDSPLVFSHNNRVYMIARRQVANEGNYDLGQDDKTLEDRATAYQLEYWSTPKRCSLWTIDDQTLAVEWLLDFPSNGDTCFASAVQLNDNQYLVYNYTSPLDDLDISWRDGQFGPTSIYGLTLSLP